MASDGEASCVCDPNFAIICSFLEKFAKTCGITHPNFLELQEMLENTQEVAQPLIELHLKLLRKARKSVLSERWEKALIKFCHTYSKPDGWELERFGYKKVPLSLKLRLLKGLLEVQFDFNSKFKADVNRLSSGELRLQPIGRDKLGHTYWSQLDEDCNLRVYREDLDDESWEIVARDREGLFKLIGQLSSNEPFNSELDALLNEDSNSQEIENPITDTGQVSKLPDSDEDVDDEGEFEEIETGDEDDFDETDDEKEVKKVELSNDSNLKDKSKEELEKVSDKSASNDIKEPLNGESQPAKIEQEERCGNIDLTNKVGDSVKSEKESSEIAQDLSQPKAAIETKENATDSSTPQNLSATPAPNPSFATDLSVRKSSVKDTKDDGLKRERDSDSLDVESATKKKRLDDLGATIEEPVMLIRGDGSGKDCNTENSENIFCKPEDEELDFGQAIEEPVMLIWGFGLGKDCDTGNPGKSSDAANGSEEKIDGNQKVQQPKEDHSGKPNQGETAHEDGIASHQEQTTAEEAAKLLDSKLALSDNELFQESMFKDSLNVKLKKGQLGDTSKGAESCSATVLGLTPTNEKTPSSVGKIVITETPSNGDKAKVTEAPLPVTKRFLHASTNASQSTSVGSSPSQDNAASTTPLTKSPPKLWTIENICAKPSETCAASPQTSLISCNTEDADGRDRSGKPQLGVQVLPKSSSPPKRASRWDVGRPGEDEGVGKCDVFDAPNERNLQPSLSPSVRTLFGAKDNTETSEIHQKVQASGVVADKALSVVPSSTMTTSLEQQKDELGDAPKLQERFSGVTADEKKDEPKGNIEESKVVVEEEAPQMGFFFGPGCLKFSKPVSSIKKDAKIIEVPKDSASFEAVNKLTESRLKMHDNSSLTATLETSSSNKSVDACETKLNEASSPDEKCPSQVLPCSNKVGEKLSLGSLAQEITKFGNKSHSGETEKITKSLTSDSNKVPKKTLLEETNKTACAPIACLESTHLNKIKSTERSIFSTTQTAKESADKVNPLLVKESTSSSDKKYPDLLQKVTDTITQVKQGSDVVAVSEELNTSDKKITNIVREITTESEIRSIAEKSDTREKETSLGNKTEAFKEMLTAAKVVDSCKVTASTSPSLKSTINFAEKLTDVKQTVAEEKRVMKEHSKTVPLKEVAINPLDPSKDSDRCRPTEQKTSSCEGKSDGHQIMEKLTEPVAKSETKKVTSSPEFPLRDHPPKVTEAVAEKSIGRMTAPPDQKALLLQSDVAVKSANELLGNEITSKTTDEIAKSSSQGSALSLKPPALEKESKQLATASQNLLKEERKVPPVDVIPAKTNTQLEKVHAMSLEATFKETEALTSEKDAHGILSKVSPKQSSISPVFQEKSIAPTTPTKQVSLDNISPYKHASTSNVTQDRNAPMSKPSIRDERGEDLSSSAVKTAVDKSMAHGKASTLKITSTEGKPTHDTVEKSTINLPNQSKTLKDVKESKEVSEKSSSTKPIDSKDLVPAARIVSLERNQSLPAKLHLSSACSPTFDKLTETQPKANIIADSTESPKSKNLAPSIKSPRKEIEYETKKDHALPKPLSVTKLLTSDPLKKELTREGPSSIGLIKVDVLEADSTRIERPREDLCKSKSSLTEKSCVDGPKAVLQKAEPQAEKPAKTDLLGDDKILPGESLLVCSSQEAPSKGQSHKMPTKEVLAENNLCNVKPSDLGSKVGIAQAMRVGVPETPMSGLPKTTIPIENLASTKDFLKLKPSAEGPLVIKSSISVASTLEPRSEDCATMEPPTQELSKIDHNDLVVKVDLPKLQPLKVEDTKVKSSKVDPPKADGQNVEPPKMGLLKKEETKAKTLQIQPSIAKDLKVEPQKVQPPKIDHLKVEPPKEDHLKVEPPKEDNLKVEPPKSQPSKKDGQKVEQPKVQPSKAEDQKVEQPKVQPSKAEDQKVEPPKVQPSKAQDQKVESPKVQPSKAEDQKVEPPKVQPSKAQDQKVEPPKVQPSKAEDQKVEPPKVQPSKAQDQKVEPPKVQPSKAEDQKVEPPKVQPSKAEDQKVELPKVQPSKAEDQKVEALKVQPSKAEDQKVEPPKVQPSKAEDQKVEPPKVQPSKAEDKKVEPPKVQPCKAEDKKVEPPKVQLTTPEPLTMEPEKAIELKEETKVEAVKGQELVLDPFKAEPPTGEKSAVEMELDLQSKPVKSNASKLREIKKIQKPKTAESEEGPITKEESVNLDETKCIEKDLSVKLDDTTTKAEPKQASILGLSFDYTPEQSTSKPQQNNRSRKTRASTVDSQDSESKDADPLGDSGDAVPSRSPRRPGAAASLRSKRKLRGANEDVAGTPDDEEVAKKKGRGRPARGGSPRKGVAKDHDDGSEQSDDAAELGVDLVCDESSIESMPSKPRRPSPQKIKSPKKTRKVLGLEIPVETESMAVDSGTPVRQSRRIAQIKIKEDAERREMEEATQAAIAQEEAFDKKKKHKHGSKQVSERDSSDQDNDNDKDFETTKRKKRKKRKKDWNRKDFDQANPWQSSSGSSSSMEEEDDEQEQSEEDEQMHRLTDHEFSPESDLEDDLAAQPLRRARTARKESAPPEEPADEADCQKCGKSDHPEWILLCDKCDAGWHCLCLRPALLVIPEGDWFCPPCQHTALIKSLHEQLKAFDGAAKRRENEELRKKRLAYVGISLDNVLPKTDGKEEAASGDESDTEADTGAVAGAASSRSSSTGGSSSDSDSEPVYQLRERRAAHVSYRFNEYDDLINSAIQDEMEVAKVAGNQGRGKDIGNIIEAEREEAAAGAEGTGTEKPANVDAEFQPEREDEEEEEEEEEDGYIPPVRKSVAKKKHRKLNSLDISSDDENGDSDEDFKGTSSEEEDEDYEEGDTDDSDVGRGRRGRGKSSGPVRRSNRPRVTRFDREFIDDNSDDSDKPARKRKPRNVWDDTSESEESDSTWGRRKKQKQRTIRTRTPRSSEKKKKKRRKRAPGGSDNETFRASKPKKPRVSFGAPDDLETVATARRTRGQKINYVEMAGSDSDEEFVKPSKKVVESEDEFVLNEEDEELMDVEDEVKDSDNESADLEEQFGEDSDIDDGPPPVLPAGDHTEKSKKESKKKKKSEFRARILQSDDSDEEPDETAFDDTLDQSDPVIDEEALAREEKRLKKEAKKLEKKELKKMGKKKKEELEMTEPIPMTEPGVEPQESPAKRKGRGRGKAALAKAAATESLPLAPGAAPPAFQPTPPVQGHSVISRMLQAQPLPGPLPGSGPPVGARSFTDAASAMGQKYFGDRTLVERPPTGDRMSMGDRMAPGDRLTMGERMPPGDRLTMGDRMPPGDRMGMGDRMTMGDRMPPGDRMPMGDRMGPRGLPPSARPPYLPRGRMPLAYRQPRSPAPHFGGPRGPAGHPALYHSAHHPHDPSPSGGGPIAISPGLDKPGHGTPPPAYSRPQAAAMGRFGPDGTPSPNGGVRHPFSGSPGNHMLGRAGTPPGRNPGPGNFSPYHQPTGYHYSGYPGAGPLGPDEPGSYQGTGYPEAYGSSPLATSDGSNSKPMDEEGSGEFGGLVSYFSSQREDDLDA